VNARSGLVLPLFSFTLFTSALLLFTLEPVVGKMVLPLFGGTPAVWNTCMVFYQAVLLAGYTYAYACSAWLTRRTQALLHLGMLLVPLLFLPLAVNAQLASDHAENPIPALLLLLATLAGLPLFAVCTSAPLLQKWFAESAHPLARDPYFLYGASNFGSMTALLAYPTLIEPHFRLHDQTMAWAVGYGLLVALTGGCALLLLHSAHDAANRNMRPANADLSSQREKSDREVENITPSSPSAVEVTWRRRLRWVLLALVPSSLMLGVTTYLTTDVAAIPLLWVLPLALYLLSFIIVFSRIPLALQRLAVGVGLAGLLVLLALILISLLPPHFTVRVGVWAASAVLLGFGLRQLTSRQPDVLHRAVAMVLPLLVLLLLFLMLSDNMPKLFGSSVVTSLTLHLLTLFVAALACHGELARDRPPARNLTEYFLWMSIGGVLGGLFNGLVAPLAFNSILEYPLVLAMSCLLMPRPRLSSNPTLRGRADKWLDLALPVGIAALTLGLQAGLLLPTVERKLETLASQLDLSVGDIYATMAFGLPALACYAFLRRPFRFGLAVVALVLAGNLYDVLQPNVLFRGRGFFGVLTVRAGQEQDGDRQLAYHTLDHGSTLHGRQFTDPDRRGEPLTYYHRTGPLGQVFAAYNADGRHPIGVIGLGTGTIAAYARPGQRLTFYEIDPLVRDLCFNDARYFSYVEDARQRGAYIDLVLGDARLTLGRQRLNPNQKYSLLVIDAFSSDAIPVHLLTWEALRDVYLEQLAEHGLLLFHITNRYLDLRPVLANMAHKVGLVGLYRRDEDTSPPGKNRSVWVVLGRRDEDLGRLRGAGVGGSPWQRWGRECLGWLGVWLGQGLGAKVLSLNWLTRAREGPSEQEPRWRVLEPDPQVGLWTDDYAPLLRVFSWKR
jgi:hypothetical protein